MFQQSASRKQDLKLRKKSLWKNNVRTIRYNISHHSLKLLKATKAIHWVGLVLLRSKTNPILVLYTADLASSIVDYFFNSKESSLFLKKNYFNLTSKMMQM